MGGVSGNFRLRRSSEFPDAREAIEPQRPIPQLGQSTQLSTPEVYPQQMYLQLLSASNGMAHRVLFERVQDIDERALGGWLC
jgi:hypothetical protein